MPSPQGREKEAHLPFPLTDMTLFLLTTLATSKFSWAWSSLVGNSVYGIESFFHPSKPEEKHYICNNISVTIFESLPALSVGSFGNMKSAPPETFSLKIPSLHLPGHPGSAEIWLPVPIPAALSYLPVPFTCRLSLTQS